MYINSILIINIIKKFSKKFINCKRIPLLITYYGTKLVIQKITNLLNYYLIKL